LDQEQIGKEMQRFYIPYLLLFTRKAENSGKGKLLLKPDYNFKKFNENDTVLCFVTTAKHQSIVIMSSIYFIVFWFNSQYFNG